MRDERKRKFETKRKDAEEKAARMEAERRAVVMKAEKQAAAVELSFYISDWLQIDFRFISDW